MYLRREVKKIINKIIFEKIIYMKILTTLTQKLNFELKNIFRYDKKRMPIE